MSLQNLAVLALVTVSLSQAQEAGKSGTRVFRGMAVAEKGGVVPEK